MTKVLIDNATIHSAVNIFSRIRTNQVVREINIVGLDNILEAYVLNDSIYMSSDYWSLWLENTPEEWHQYYYEIFYQTNPITIDFDKFNNFISSEIVFFILNTFIAHAKHKTTLEYDFLTYTGQDFGNYEIKTDDLFLIDKTLKEKWDWNYSHANKDHIDIVMMAYRTIEYIKAAEKSGFNLITHSIRNEFISEIGYAYGFDIYRDYNKKAYDELRKKITGNLTNPIAQRITFLREKSEIIWSKIKFPLLSAVIYENSSSVQDIFKEANNLREKLRPFRKKINEIKHLLKENQFKKADKEINQLVTYIDKLSLGTKKTEVDVSFESGFPLGFVLGITAKIETPRYLRIFTDLNQRFHLPNSYVKSCERLFSNIRWNKKLTDNSAGNTVENDNGS